MLIPDDSEIKRTILAEVHLVPYSGHVGYQKMFKQIQKTFYCTNLVLDVRDIVLGCPVCQQEKSLTKVPASILEPLTFTKQK